MKIAYVSDSIGSPKHPRGIFHYSAGFIKLLSSRGHEIDVVVPCPRMITKKPFKLPHTQPELSDVIKSAIIGSFLTNYESSSREPFRSQNFLKSFLKKIIGKVRNLSWINFLFNFVPFYYEKPIIVPNKFSELDYVPLTYSFFNKVCNFLLFNRMYRQYPFLPRKKIDLRNYDLILFDAPHDLKLKKNPHTPVVSIIYDLIPLTDLFPSTSRKFFIKRLNCTLKISDKLVFISKMTRNIFNKHLIYFNPTAIIYPIFAPTVTLDELAKHNFLTSLSPEFVKITTIVSDEIRKNVQGIIDAHGLLPDHYCLEIIGNINPDNYKISSKSQAARITFIGSVSEVEKVTLLYTADVFCFPSLAEGFGIPVIEGLYYTGRVVCSDIPVFQEIADKHAIFCDPVSPFDIADKIQEAVARPKLDKGTREQVVLPFSCNAQTSVFEMLINQV